MLAYVYNEMFRRFNNGFCECFIHFFIFRSQDIHRYQFEYRIFFLILKRTNRVFCFEICIVVYKFMETIILKSNRAKPSLLYFCFFFYTLYVRRYYIFLIEF